MVVITLVSCPPALSGDLTKWLFEINSGVYVGNVSARVREAVWMRICDSIKNGQATMVYSACNEQHMEFRVWNSGWKQVDYDGITLMKRPLVGSSFGEQKLEEGFSNASKQRMARRYNKSRRVLANPYAFVDLETTGLNPTTDDIIEIGAVVVSEGKIEERLSILIKQEKRIPEQIIALTGITDEMCEKEGDTLVKALERLSPILKGRIAVCYNAAFDIAFIKEGYRRKGLSSPIERSLDVLSLARRKIMSIENYKLETVAKYLGIADSEKHRALADSEMLYSVFFKLNEM